VFAPEGSDPVDRELPEGALEHFPPLALVQTLEELPRIPRRHFTSSTLAKQGTYFFFGHTYQKQIYRV
jgi:hypothetical protein